MVAGITEVNLTLVCKILTNSYFIFLVCIFCLKKKHNLNYFDSIIKAIRKQGGHSLEINGLSLQFKFFIFIIH